MENTSYRILAFQHNRGFTTLRPGGTYWMADHPNDHSEISEPGGTLDYMLRYWKEEWGDNAWIKIYSIQDLNTGTTYSIGDTISIAGEGKSNIIGFDIYDNWTGGFGIHINGQTAGVSIVSKIPIKFND